MSWLARSIANSLHLDDDDDDNDNDVDHHHHHQKNDAVQLEEADLEDRFDNIELNNQNHADYHDDDDDTNNDDNQGRGMKEDLSEFTETLTRQLWGVASFLAPPPPPPPPPPPMSRRLELDRKVTEESDRSGSENESEDEEYVEDSGNYSDDVEDDAVGVTEEALAFAQNIAHHPETWLDFPLSEEEEAEDFEISDAQHKHALAIERLATRLAALRIELCPAHMTEGYFWMVYFVLLHSRLNKHDADLLSTPQLVQARAMWMQELQKQTNPGTEDWFGRKTSYSQGRTYSPRADFDPDPYEDFSPSYMSHTTYAAEPRSYHAPNDFDTEKHPIECNGVQFMNKSVEDPSGESEKELLAGPSKEVLLQDYDDDGDDWLEDTAELEGYSASGVMVGHEEDVSFSDLEEDSDWTMPLKSK